MRRGLDEPLALEATYQSSWVALTRLAFLLVGDRSEAEDIVQSAFTTAAARWSSIDDPLAYLRRAIVNRANDVHRRTSRATRRVAFANEWLEAPEIDELWSKLGMLSDAQRAVIVLRYYEDLELVDIAEVLNRPASTVRSDLRRALMKLKELLT